MTFTEPHATPREQIAQLEEQIRAAEAERRRIRLEHILELDQAGLSRRAIGEQVGLSHGAVHQILAIHRARQEGAA